MEDKARERRTRVAVNLSRSPQLWHSSVGPSPGGIRFWVRGHARTGSTCEREGRVLLRDLTREVSEVSVEDGKKRLGRLIPSLNGHWGMIVQWDDDDVWLVADRVRSVPLFYREIDGGIMVGEDLRDLVSGDERSAIDDISAVEFLLSGAISGDRTLVSGVRKLRAGEIVRWNRHLAGESFASERYFRYYPSQVSSASEATLEEECKDVLFRMFNAFVEANHDCNVVVPLSGGFDSRLVAAMLSNVGFDKVLCFSYGSWKDEEVRLSREVAKSLGFRWEFIDYRPGRWRSALTSDQLWDSSRFMCRGASRPHFQDYFAIDTLLARDCIDEKTIIFPGHTGDMLSGGHLTRPAYMGALENPPDAIVKRNYSIWGHPSSWLCANTVEALEERIKRYMIPPSDVTETEILNSLECWNAEHRQALFIINSVRSYEHKGIRWRTLWDSEFMDFFLRVPMEFKKYKRLYTNVLRDRIFVGRASKLAEIPIAGVGDWTSRERVAKTVRKGRVPRWLRRCRGRGSSALTRYVFGNKMESLNGKNEALPFLEGCDIDPRSSVREVVAMFVDWEGSPEIFRSLAQQVGDRSIREVSWFQLMTIMSLVDYFSGLREAGQFES